MEVHALNEHPHEHDGLGFMLFDIAELTVKCCETLNFGGDTENLALFSEIVEDPASFLY